MTFTTTPEQREANRQRRAALDIAHAKTLAIKAAEYAADLECAKGEYTPRVWQSLFALCNAAINVADDGDFLTCRDNIADEHGWDAEGYPAESEELSFDPSRVHPDDPCQPKGLR